MKVRLTYVLYATIISITSSYLRPSRTSVVGVGAICELIHIPLNSFGTHIKYHVT